MLSPLEIFDYKKLYEPVLDPDLAYYQEPHQFCVKTFRTKDCKVVLVHYKQWTQSATWLPTLSNINGFMNEGPNTVASMPSEQSELPSSKRRKMSRHSTTMGQIIVKVKQQVLANSTQKIVENCEINLPSKCCDNENPLVFNEESRMCPTISLPAKDM